MHINKEGRAGRCAGSEERGNAFVSGRLMVKRPPAILPPLTGVSLTITITRRAFLRVGEEGTVGYGLAKVIRNSRARFRTVESSYDYVPSRGEKWSSCTRVPRLFPAANKFRSTELDARIDAPSFANSVERDDRRKL